MFKGFSPSETITSLLLAFCCKPHFVSFCIYQLGEKFSNTKGVCMQISEAAGRGKARKLCAVYTVVTEVQWEWEGQRVGNEYRDSHHQAQERTARFTIENFQLNTKRKLAMGNKTRNLTLAGYVDRSLGGLQTMKI